MEVKWVVLVYVHDSGKPKGSIYSVSLDSESLLGMLR